ncbi:MAG TPA: winged helix-turn-helix domain-containing protein [Acidimicrobiia bacterium]
MADQLSPDYELEETLPLENVEQFKALFDETRMQIADLLLERAATVSELAAALSRPKGTVGHHVGVMEEAGLIQVVRTKKVRAIEAKYYGRTARTFLLTSRFDTDLEISPDYFLASAAAEFSKASVGYEFENGAPMMSTLRYARIPEDRAAEWVMRVSELTQEFASEPRDGGVTYGMLVAFYPTDRPHLPDR